jgi:RHS repeat-associated protein
VTSIANNADHGRDQTLTYDPLNRILSAKSSSTSGADCWGQNFGPDGTVADDAVANLTKINNGTQTPPPCILGSLNATVDANNHINTDSTYAYDAAGNMTKDGSGTGWLYTFDAENRLTLAAGPMGGPYCYVYDGFGLRVAKKSSATTCSSGTVTKLYWRSISGDALAETDGTGSVSNAAYAEYVFFAGRRIASRNGSGGIFYYFADQLGSTRSITTGSGKNGDGSNQTPGQLCYDADFTPYGQEISYTQTGHLQATACPPNYKFTGYERDPETGLDYAFARYYSSRIGRFLSTDPLGGAIGDLQSHNAYAYTLNNPTNLTDPSGLHCVGSGWGHSFACDDNPYPGGGGSCGLDCASGAGFAGMLGGGGGVGLCPAEFQGCIDNGNGGFTGLVGSGLAYTGCHYYMRVEPADPPGGVECDDATVFFASWQKLLDALAKARLATALALLNDPSCLAFLGGAAVPFLNNGSIRVTGYSAAGPVAATTQVPASTPGSLPTYEIDINESGPFFKAGRSYQGGLNAASPRFQAFVLFHELGHVAGVLKPEGSLPNVDKGIEATNSAAIASNCKHALSSLSNSVPK